MDPAQGGGLAQALKSLGQGLAAVSQDEQVPEGARAAFAASLQAFEEGMAALQGGEQAPAPSEPVSMEQGASGAVPVSHGRPG